MGTSNISRSDRDLFAPARRMGAIGIPARRRIGGADTTFIYDGGILMDVLGLVSGISQTVGIYKTAVETLDEAKIAAATNELTAQLIQLGAEVLVMQKDGLQATERERSLLRSNNDLGDRVRELEKRISERERYDLVEDYPGTYALRIKEACRDGEPMHYLCPGCMDNKAMKSILQFNTSDKVIGACHACGKGYRFSDTPNRLTREARNERY